MTGLGKAVLQDARTVWDHLSSGSDPACPVDVIVALGCRDERVARRAADLMLAGAAPLMVVTGGIGKDTPAEWTSEAAQFEAIAREAGVPARRIRREGRSTNTGENINLTRRLLESEGLEVSSVLLVTKPYMRRRAAATAAQRWPEVCLFTTAPLVSFEEYLDSSDAEQITFLSLMAGDLQRMRVYAERGFQAVDPVPADVWSAFERLAAAGYDAHVLPP
ncbi:YdcF family protein [uncultured Pseudokineococcus sp.]|uniref:YdcF family protein n=1 Tax=uncultured Pseudokineococcus sp. TaxID=1642928 RepID=UPI002608A6A2|nr:YdcF family protein [uncultured Pseudokineococcus sp.]